MPITIKENVDYEGRPNPNGVPAQMHLIAPSDSPVVRNLKNAGAIVIGLTNTPEFSFRGFTDNPLHGLTLNPWDPEITCGGSSGGAGSSVAAGIGTIAHGNDIGGSLRWPAHCNGIATIKPTQGRIPAYQRERGGRAADAGASDVGAGTAGAQRRRCPARARSHERARSARPLVGAGAAGRPEAERTDQGRAGKTAR